MSGDRQLNRSPGERAGTIGPHDADALLGQLDEIRAAVVRDLEGAFAALERMETLVEQRGEPRLLARFFAVRAHALNYATRYAEAEQAGRTAIRHAETAGDETEAARGWMTLVHAQAKLGKLADALESALSAERSFVAADRLDLAVQALSNAAIVTRMLGDGSGAIRMFERALAMREHEPVTRAQIESGLAEALLDVGRFTDAERAFTASAQAFESIGVTRAAAIVRGNLADLYGRQGRLAAAIEQFEVARRFFEADEATGELGRILTEQADVYASTGLSDEAIAGYRRAGELLKAAGAVQEQARALTGLGRMLATREPARADQVLDRASRLYDSAGNTAGAALARLQLATLRFAAGETARARETLDAAAPDLQGRSAETLLCDLLSASLDADAGRLDEAERALDRCEARASDIGLPILRAETLTRRARVREQAGRLGEAVRDAIDAVECIDRLRGTLQASRFRAGLLGGNRSMFAQAIRLLLEAGSVTEAFEMTERARGRTLLDLVESGGERVDSVEQDDEPSERLLGEIAKERAELNAIYSSHDPMSGPSGRAGWLERVREVETRISELETRLHASGRGREVLGIPESFARIAAELRNDRALVSYWQDADRTLAFVVRTGGLLCVDLAPTDEIEQAIQDAMFQIRRGLMRGPSGAGEERRQTACRRALESLHAAIWQPIAHLIGETPDVVVVPAGPLHTVPFSALFDGERYLAETAAISVLPTASLLPLLKRDSTTRGTSVCVIAAPDRIAPEIEAEASLLRDAMPDATVVVGAGATASAVAEHASDSAVLHLACHGAFPPNNPLAAGLKLADRWVTVRDVLAWRLPGSVVVLSGCETGRNSLESGEELFGFGRGFFAAGAKGLVVSLWIAHDASTRGLMSEMYRAIGRSTTPSEIRGALVSAQRSQIRAGIHPAFWSNFVYLGA